MIDGNSGRDRIRRCRSCTGDEDPKIDPSLDGCKAQAFLDKGHGESGRL